MHHNISLSSKQMINRKMPFMKNIIGFLYNSMKIDEQTIDYMHFNYKTNRSDEMRDNLTKVVTNKFGKKYVQPYWAIVDNIQYVKNITWANFLTGKRCHVFTKTKNTENNQFRNIPSISNSGLSHGY